MPARKIAIIGAGVAGCYSAYRLVNDASDVDVQIYEKSKRIGGRLYSLLDSKDPLAVPIELGGMTFAAPQKNITSLVRHLGLETETVEFDRQSQFLRGAFLNRDDYVHPPLVPFRLDSDEERLNPYDLLLKALLSIYPDYRKNWPFEKEGLTKSETYHHLRTISTAGYPLKGLPLYKWGFWNLLSQILSTEAYNLVHQAIGLSTMFRNVNAFDAIWNILQDNQLSKASEHYRLTGGYASLPESLLKQSLENKSVHTGHHLKEVQVKKNRSISLVFDVDNSEKIASGFDSVILALPRGCIDRIDFTNADKFQKNWAPLSRSVKRVFGSRLYLIFEDDWWNLSKFGPGKMKPNEIHYTTTDLPLRNCTYLAKKEGAKHAVLIASFADGVASSFWSGLVHPNTRNQPQFMENSIAPNELRAPERMVDEAIAQLQMMHSDVVVPRPVDGIFVDWSRQPSGTGWHAFEPYSESSTIIPQSRKPDQGVELYVCGETFVHHHGWVESAINSSEMLMQEYFSMERAEWIDQEYLIEPKELQMENKLKKLLEDLSKEPDLLTRFLDDKEAVMTDYELTEEEKEVLRTENNDAIRMATGENVPLTIVWDDKDE